jgi:RHS repeat-associated protein
VNRPTSITYSDSTPTVNFAYDGAPNGTGQLTSITAAGISTMDYPGFDAMGRVTASNQQIGGKTYNFTYEYNLAGALTSETYPSGRLAMTSYDQTNRPTTLSGSLSGQVTNYVTASRYWAATKYWTIYGNSVWNIWGAYNPRLQPTTYWQNVNNLPNTALRMEIPNWVDGSGHNNGTLQGTTILAGGPDLLVNLPQYQQTFGYDGLNRLTSASENGGWSQTYQYDAWGNMWMPTSNGLPVNGAMPTTNVYSANGPGYNQNPNVKYDEAGNQKAFGALNLTYDAENRQISAANTLGGGTAAYYYDGAGQRVMKVLPNGTTVYVYDAFGQLAAEYASGPAAGSPCGSTCYLSYDLLGSVRLVTDGQAHVIARHDYAPFGQEIPAGVGGRTNFWAASDNINPKFTGQERDGETNLDFFQARYMASGLARFMSADPANAGVDFMNPQSWNGYAYVLGNPLSMVDPSGLDPIKVDCPDCTVTVNGGSSDPLDLANVSWWYGLSGYDPNSPLFTDTVTLKLPVITESTPSSRLVYIKSDGSTAAFTKTCIGSSRGLAGNTLLFGRTGRFGTIRPNTAAIIPRQFGYKSDVAGRDAIYPFAADINGVLRGTVSGKAVTSFFDSVTDVIGGKSPIPGLNVRDFLMRQNPNKFIVEVTGGRDVGPNASVTLTVSMFLSCPAGTKEKD